MFRSALLAAGFTAAIFLAGCESHKPPPAIIHANNYTSETLKSQQVLPPGQRILGLKEAIRIGLTNSPTYKQQQLAIVTAWATFYSSLAGYSPTLVGTYGPTQTQWNSSSTPSGINTVPYMTWSGNLAAAWNVFNGLQTTMDTMANRASALSAEELELDARRNLIYSITTAYNSILLSRAQIQIALSDVTFNEQQYQDTQLKYNAGASSLTDLLKFKIDRDSAQDGVITATAAYKVNRFALAALMGLSTANLPEETQFPPLKVAEDQEYSLNVDFYIDTAMDLRPDLKSARLVLENKKYSLYSKWGAFSPTVDLSMNYGFTTTMNGRRGRAVPNGDDLSYDYGFDVNWDVWKGGSRIADVRGAQAALDSQEEQLMITWITVVQQVRSAYTNLLANIAHRKLQGKILTMTQKRRDLTREEYNAGNIEITELTQAQSELIQAESNHVISVINVANSRAQLDQVCGINVVE